MLALTLEFLSLQLTMLGGRLPNLGGEGLHRQVLGQERQNVDMLCKS